MGSVCGAGGLGCHPQVWLVTPDQGVGQLLCLGALIKLGRPPRRDASRVQLFPQLPNPPLRGLMLGKSAHVASVAAAQPRAQTIG